MNKEVNAAIELYDFGQIKAEDAIEHIRLQLRKKEVIKRTCEYYDEEALKCAGCPLGKKKD